MDLNRLTSIELSLYPVSNNSLRKILSSSKIIHLLLILNLLSITDEILLKNNENCQSRSFLLGFDSTPGVFREISSLYHWFLSKCVWSVRFLCVQSDFVDFGSEWRWSTPSARLLLSPSHIIEETMRWGAAERGLLSVGGFEATLRPEAQPSLRPSLRPSPRWRLHQPWAAKLTLKTFLNSTCS